MSKNGKVNGANGDTGSLIQQAAQAWHKRETDTIRKAGQAIPQMGMALCMDDECARHLFTLLHALGVCAKTANDQTIYDNIGTVLQYVAYNRARTQIMGPIFKVIDQPEQPAPPNNVIALDGTQDESKS